ncbi:DUF1850 domain-containing protein [Archaeoglobus veneficus]|uniref:DUF1850 domain-containing protein n=1 Tax=Archaeoglobus veneficus (strain DSM 11195 / SNP6) TaxID=693661 RepID=F2KPW6_ARCVS|nr:DUF1850 domain-containing protein [Archaeoglobus veneficus]AEA46473.1 Domain of unknown function DUF1850 [Archaeoglobus veneficus SNP6]
MKDKAITVLSALLIVILLSSAIPVKVLMVEGKNTTVIAVKDGDEVKISFIHSVELCPWVEIYVIEGNNLTLVKTLTQSAGWGLPSTENNFSFQEIDGQKWMVYEIHRTFSSLKISTSPINNYTISVNGKVLKFSNGFITVSIKNIPCGEFLIREVLGWT